MDTFICGGYIILAAFSLIWMQMMLKVFYIKYLTIPVIFYFAYMLLIYVPSFFIAQKMTGIAKLDFVVGVTSVVIAFPLGMSLVNIIAGFHVREIRGFYLREIFLPTLNLPFNVAYFLITIFAVTLVISFLLEIPRIPLIDMFRMPGNRLELTLAREEVTKLTAYIVPPHFYALLRNTVFPFLSLTAFCIFYFYRRKTWLWIFILISGAGIFYMLLALQRKEVFLLMVMYFLLFYLLRHGSVGVKFYLFSVIGVFAIPYLITLLRGTKGYLEGIEKIWGVFDALIIHRLFKVPADVLASYFEVFPDVQPFLYGRSIGLLSTLMGWDFFPVANFVAQYRGTTIDSSQANAAFIGFAYADFGLLGVIVSGLLAGFMLQVLNIWVLRRRKTIFSFILIVMISISSLSLIVTAMPTVLISKGLVPAIFLVITFNVLQSFIRQTIKPDKYKDNHSRSALKPSNSRCAGIKFS